jgi:hypothetical protein
MNCDAAWSVRAASAATRWSSARALRLSRGALAHGVAFLLAVGMFLIPAQQSLALDQESPEVLALVDKGLAYLDKGDHSELGGKCLIALAYHKRGLSEGHPKIQAALEACRKSIEEERGKNYIYGKCLAIIFLCEVDSSGQRELIHTYAEMLKPHQQEHGGFGYLGMQTGDTSQTQYAALAYWELLNHGISPDAQSVQKCLNWLIRTQDPSGSWGYQGMDPGNFTRVEQADRPGLSMAAAGMSGTLILGNAVGLLKAPEPDQQKVSALDVELPKALKREDVKKEGRVATLPAGDVDPKRLAQATKDGHAWFDKNFKIQTDLYECYYLYSIERYRSFEEYLAGSKDKENWYAQGFEYLKKSQSPDGSWNDQTGQQCATAFSILFLLRSTQKSIEASLGEGTLVGGRGLPRDLSKVKLRGGKLVVESKPTEVDNLLGLLDEDSGQQSEALDELVDDPAALKVNDVGPDQARRLQQIVKTGPAGARVLAVRALGKLRNLDYAPTLIFALTDPDKRVVREARDALRSVSRNFEGFGPSDNYQDAERDEAVQRWKAWYRKVRPDAPPLP